MTRPVDVRGILERAGADADAPEGSQAWALAQVDAAVGELIEAATSAKNALAIIAVSEESDTSDKYYQLLFEDLPSLRAALANVGSAS